MTRSEWLDLYRSYRTGDAHIGLTTNGREYIRVMLRGDQCAINFANRMHANGIGLKKYLDQMRHRKVSRQSGESFCKEICRMPK